MDEEILQENVKRLTEALGRGRRTSQVSGWLLRRVRQAIQSARHSHAGSLENTLWQIHRDIDGFPEKRDERLCRALLESLALLPAAGAAMEDVVRVARMTFQRCRRSTFRDRLRREMKARQWSGFTAERQAVGKMRESEPVDDEEILLLSRERAWPDVRSAIAGRIVLHLQAERLTELLRYLMMAVRRLEQHDPERVEAIRLLHRLSDFDPVEIIPPLILAYFEHYDHTGARGELLKALSRFAELLLAPLQELYREQAEERPKILRLWRTLAVNRSPAAAQCLCSLAQEEPSLDLEDICHETYEALADYVNRTPRFDQDPEMLAVFDGLRANLEHSAHPRHQRLLADMTKVRASDESLSLEFVEHVVAGKPTPEERRRVQRGGLVALVRLRTIFNDSMRLPKDRSKAVQMAGENAAARYFPGLGDDLWHLFIHETDLPLRIAALRLLERSRWHAPENARDMLWNYYQTGAPALREAITEAWPRLLPGSRLNRGETAES